MNRSAVEALHNKARQKYEAAMAAAKEEFDKTVKAIERVVELIGDETADTIRPQRSMASAVRNAVANMRGSTFTTQSVIEALDAEFEIGNDRSRRASVANVLRRMVSNGLLDVVAHGTGPNPTTYKWTKNLLDKESPLEAA